MRVPRLFVDLKLQTNESICLNKEQAHYISHVLRCRVGDKLVLFNNTDEEYLSVIAQLSKKSAEINIMQASTVVRESPINITIALAISRSQHMDYAIQKAVELGVYKIIPLITEFSNVRLEHDRVDNKLAHWRSIIASACEQCGRTRLPEILSPIAFHEWIKGVGDETCLLLQPGSDKNLAAINPKFESLTVLIGSEGGFSDGEQSLAIERGAIPVSLGPRILRTETAVSSILSIAQYLFGDLN